MRLKQDVLSGADKQEKLTRALESEQMWLRVWAARKLGEIGNKRALPSLQNASSDPSFLHSARFMSGAETYALWACWAGRKLKEEWFPVRRAAREAIALIEGRE